MYLEKCTAYSLTPGPSPSQTSSRALINEFRRPRSWTQTKNFGGWGSVKPRTIKYTIKSVERNVLIEGLFSYSSLESLTRRDCKRSREVDGEGTKGLYRMGRRRDLLNVKELAIYMGVWRHGNGYDKGDRFVRRILVEDLH